MSSLPDNLFDLVIRNVRLEEDGALADIAVRNGLIAAIESNFRCDAVLSFDGKGNFAFGGFVDTHVHLDKACILDRCSICEGTLTEAVRETARAKPGFTEHDVYERAARVVEKAISHGTVRMRTFVEIDPRAGFRSFEAIKRIRADYAFAIDIQICAFAQDGLTNEPETLDMLDAALAGSADLIGGCPYTDPDPEAHIAKIFELAVKHDVAVDFHLDFSLDPNKTDLPAVIAATKHHGWQGRVSIGHVTNLSALPQAIVIKIANNLSEAGIALTILPATDLFLNGCGHDHLVPRGVAPAHILAAHGVVTSIATNNVLNPFTPYGDASLMRMANLYANVAQLSRDAEIADVFDMVARSAARQLDVPHGLVVGSEATIILVDAKGPRAAVREIGRVVAGWKSGRQSFHNGNPKIHRPSATQSVGHPSLPPKSNRR
ncbi:MULTISPECIES: amidohydrolase family protein [unclassified Rhizobium]|uniref:amidohydrolase family protein n=1 Tax=unclassified Rhizobium TaxID=2613769 RepID=UPI001ADB1960|nr:MULTISPECIES: amidohydrolase family protein [unclassified Rhizobium]MBO9126718.1 amidohydrolase family protein [Rhizobium sp. 16-488-2b]MBO9177165.1 amidohydrolase family protein [Rhizobium sp. 16-488-2a]